MKFDTLLAHAGRDPQRFEGLVNPPVARASTILHENMASFNAAAANKHDVPYYGRFGTSTTKLLAQACAHLDGGAGAVLFPSGLAAIAGTLGALLKPGSHLLMVDSVYGPVREFCEKVLQPHGIATTFYAPQSGADIAGLIRPQTHAIYCESPGSHTFEVQDLPAIGAAAAALEIPVVIDNTWATPYFFQPLAHGADIAIQAATKYLVGHSDAMLGVAVCTQKYLPVLQRSAALNGNCVSPDDCYLALRGIRTLGVRLRQHFAGAMTVARWMQGCPVVNRVHYPPLSSGLGRELWERDFTGASGLFGAEFQPACAQGIDRFVDSLQLFGIGVSWGGYESLVLPSHVRRTLPSGFAGPLVRFHIGLEDPDDLIADLAQAFRAVGWSGERGAQR
jgi:cysteine-S-conjugate beta-lyase